MNKYVKFENGKTFICKVATKRDVENITFCEKVNNEPLVIHALYKGKKGFLCYTTFFINKKLRPYVEKIYNEMNGGFSIEIQ